MEAARQLLAKKGGNQPYTDFNHDDREASGRPLRFAFDGNLGVIGLTRRTPRAVELTAGDPPEFQAFSPHVPIDSDTGEALGLYMNCGGFVNRPLFGDSTSLSAAAHLQHELVAADPNDVALVSAAPDIVEHTNAAEKEKPTMKELIAKLCAAWKIAKPVDQVTEAELITAFDQSTQETAALTGKVALVEPVITALGYAKDATPKAEELTGKITELNQRPANVDELIGREIADFAAATGIIAPAEEADWRDKLKKDRVNRTKELVGKTPSVLIGKLITEQRTTPPAADDTFKEAQELVAKDPAFKAIAEKQGADIALGRAVEAVLVKKQKM